MISWFDIGRATTHEESDMTMKKSKSGSKEGKEEPLPLS